jgi:hypothetical protein
MKVKQQLNEFDEKAEYYIKDFVTTGKMKVNKIERIVKIDNKIYKLFIPSPKELINDFSVPEDCKYAVLLHMMFSLRMISDDKNMNHDEKENLIKMFVVYLIYMQQMNLNNNQVSLKESFSNNLFDDLKKLSNKKNNKTKDNLCRLTLFIDMIRKSHADDLIFKHYQKFKND